MTIGRLVGILLGIGVVGVLFAGLIRIYLAFTLTSPLTYCENVSEIFGSAGRCGNPSALFWIASSAVFLSVCAWIVFQALRTK